MSDATDLRDYFKTSGRFRAQYVLEATEWDDETATTVGSTGDDRLEALAQSAIYRFQQDFCEYLPTAYPLAKEIAALILLSLLARSNEDLQDEAWYKAEMEDLTRYREQRRVAPVTASGYAPSSAPTTRPPLDESIFEDFVPDAPSSTTSRSNA
jgi:hypothetical protein